jgi:hypothetical protein
MPRKPTHNIGKSYLCLGLLIELNPYVTCSIWIKLNQSTHLSFEPAFPKAQLIWESFLRFHNKHFAYWFQIRLLFKTLLAAGSWAKHWLTWGWFRTGGIVELQSWRMNLQERRYKRSNGKKCSHSVGFYRRRDSRYMEGVKSESEMKKLKYSQQDFGLLCSYSKTNMAEMQHAASTDLKNIKNCCYINLVPVHAT